MRPPPGWHDLVACSREGAGLAEGIAQLFMWGALAIVVTVLVAVVSGTIVGARKGRVGHQVLVHLLWGGGLFIVVPVLMGAAFVAFGLVQGVLMARDTVVYDAWLAPLRNPAPGEFDRALGAVMNAKDADTLARRLYLIDALPAELDKLDVSLNERERTALAAAARQLRTENVERNFGSHPSNLERLDGAVTWFSLRPELAAALQACGNRVECAREVLGAAERWCWNHGAACRDAMTPERIAAASALFRRDSDDQARVKGLPGRAEEGVRRAQREK